MKLILRSDVENLGRLGDVVDVKPGYGRNYLVPQGLAMTATKANTKAFELERKKLQSQMDEIRGEAQAIAEKIEAMELLVRVRVGEGDKLYGSVTSPMIGDQMAADGVDIDRRKIVLEEPIRALGDYSLTVKLHPDVHVELKVKVVRHDYDPEVEAAKQAEAEAEAKAAAEAAEAAEATEVAAEAAAPAEEAEASAEQSEEA